MILLSWDDDARSAKGSLHSVRDALAARGLAATDLPDLGELASVGASSEDQLLLVGGGEIVRRAAAAVLSLPEQAQPSVGIVGSADNDFVRTFGLDRGPFVAFGHAVSETIVPIDVMRLDVEGTQEVAANAVDVGFGALLLERRGGKTIRPRHRFAAARTLDPEAVVHVTVDHTDVTEPLSRVIVSNGQFLGTEGRVSPRALPDDGRLNVQLWGIFGDELVVGPRDIHVGEHLGHERIREYQTTTITIEADQPLPVAADGTVVGTTPVRVDVATHALRLHV